ncbi:hypothetical protein [Streptomyces nigrescens]|uniref:Uncharacterized protein n=1 Tax=Streptomyces nigrescens TaxID=1920 RepID=A0A640T8M6_STRNI|nr:hypothetical protein [Streptomyces libani]WAT94958.1 hypothetical protein STRLI_000630 [Streptomyces libani subsp. libani]GFE20107.1 hypothetical protein Sliba_05600 [Streptomyces libani subsp. libani]GGV85898.1 hypothetical protein GCM10010500_03130 [Streptomyces libani subsp. libani]
MTTDPRIAVLAAISSPSATAILQAREPLADWLDNWVGTDIREDGPMPEDRRAVLGQEQP